MNEFYFSTMVYSFFVALFVQFVFVQNHFFPDLRTFVLSNEL